MDQWNKTKGLTLPHASPYSSDAGEDTHSAMAPGVDKKTLDNNETEEEGIVYHNKSNDNKSDDDKIDDNNDSNNDKA